MQMTEEEIIGEGLLQLQAKLNDLVVRLCVAGNKLTEEWKIAELKIPRTRKKMIKVLGNADEIGPLAQTERAQVSETCEDSSTLSGTTIIE